MPLSPLLPDLARARREQASPRDLVRIVRGADPPRDPVPFKILTDGVTATYFQRAPDEEADLDRPIIRGVTTSTDVDLYGSRMARPAVAAMLAEAQRHLTCFLNHSYTIPEDLLGSCVQASLARRKGADGAYYADLDIAVAVVPPAVNDRALRCWEAIRAGTKLGFSIGAYVLDWQWQLPDGTALKVDESDPWAAFLPPAEDAVMTFLDVLLLETSLVGIPANRRSWVQDATRAVLKTGRGLVQAHQARHLGMGPGGRAMAPLTRADEDAARTAQAARARACGIGVKEGGNVTCPSAWQSIAADDAAWGDYTNYRYPMPDKDHADNAAARWGDTANRSEYSHEEQAIISRRIEARQRHFGEGEDQSDEQKDRDMPEDEITTGAVPAAPDYADALAATRDASPYADPAPAATVTHLDGTPVARDADGLIHGAPPVGLTDAERAALPAIAHPAPGDPNVGDDGAAAPPAEEDAPEAEVDLFGLLDRTLALIAARGANVESSREHTLHVLNMHDRAAHMLNMRCCGMGECNGHDDDPDYSGRTAPADAAAEDRAVAPDLTLDLTALQAEGAAVRHHLDRAMAQLAEVRAQRDLLRAEVAQAESFLARAVAVPGERPTRRQPRTAEEIAALPYEERVALTAAVHVPSPYED